MPPNRDLKAFSAAVLESRPGLSAGNYAEWAFGIIARFRSTELPVYGALDAATRQLALTPTQAHNPFQGPLARSGKGFILTARKTRGGSPEARIRSYVHAPRQEC
jgi:hypothetical protein